MVILGLICEWVAIGDEDVSEAEDGATKGANTYVGLKGWTSDMSCRLDRICQ